MSSDAKLNGTLERPHQRWIQSNCPLKFHNIRRSALCRALEKQFHLPTTFVDLGDHQRRELEVVGEELQSTLVLNVQVAHAPQRIGISFRRFDGGQDNGVVRAYAGGLVYRVRVAPLKQNILFRADNEECRAECEHKQAGEIQVAAIHNVECTSFRNELVQDVHIPGFAIGDADKRRNIAVQVEQGMHLHSRLVATKLGPGEQ